MAGGEVGSGHSAMAIFEIVPTNNKFFAPEPMGSLYLQYKKDCSDSAINIAIPLTARSPVKIDSADMNLRLATGICMYASLLRKSKHCKGFDLMDISNLVAPVLRKDNYLHQEFLTLLEKTDEIYHINKKKRKKEKGK